MAQDPIKPGRTLKHGATGKVMTEQDLISKGATTQEIDTMIADGGVEDVTEAPAVDTAAPAPAAALPKKKEDSLPSGGLSGFITPAKQDTIISASGGAPPKKPEPGLWDSFTGYLKNMFTSGDAPAKPAVAKPAIKSKGTDIDAALKPVGVKDSTAAKKPLQATDIDGAAQSPVAAVDPDPPRTLPPPPVLTQEQIKERMESLISGNLVSDATAPALQQLRAQAEAKEDIRNNIEPRMKILTQIAMKSMLADKKTYFKTNRPKLEFDGGNVVSDDRYTTVNEKALDRMLESDDLSDDDRQEVRNRILREVAGARGTYDIVKAAKENYQIGQDVEASDLNKSNYERGISAQLRASDTQNPLGGRPLSPIAGQPAADASTIRKMNVDERGLISVATDSNAYDYLTKPEFEKIFGSDAIDQIVHLPGSKKKVLKDQYGNISDPLTIEAQNYAEATKDMPAITERATWKLEAKQKELQEEVNNGKKSPDDAGDELSRYRIELMGTVENFVKDKVRSLNRSLGIPTVYQGEIDALKEKMATMKPGEMLHDMAKARLDKLEALQASGDYSGQEPDGTVNDLNWGVAMQKGYKQVMVEKNEMMKDVFNHVGMDNKSIESNAPLKGERNFLTKQLTGVFSGIGALETMTGGILNMYGMYSLGNKITKRGEEYSAANALPMPISKEGEEQVIDDDPATWIARNVAGNIPVVAALAATAEFTGPAMAGFMEGLGIVGKASPFLKGALGGGASAIPESMMEAGDKMNGAIAEGKTVAQARESAYQVFYENMIMTGFSNPIEFGLMKLPLKGKLGSVAHAGIEANINGSQEVIQEWIQQKQTNPAITLMEYAMSPEGRSTYLSGAGVGILQSTAMGKLQEWQIGRATNSMFDYNGQYKNAGNQALPGNFTIARTAWNAMRMNDSHNRPEQIKKTIDKLEASGAYTEEDANRVKSIIDDVASIKGQVPDYGTEQQKTAVFNELLQIHTNNRFAEKSGMKDIGDMMQENNAVSTERIKRIMTGKEPLYFFGGNETNKEQLLKAVDEVEKAGKLDSKILNIQVTNDPATQKILVDKINAAKTPAPAAAAPGTAPVKPAPVAGTETIVPESGTIVPESETKTAIPVVGGFTTAKGSTYEVHEDGTTTRNKAARPDPGHEGQEGVQPKSEKTVYITKEQGDQLSIVQTEGWKEGERPTIKQDEKTGNIAVVLEGGKNDGKSIKGTIVTPKTAPEVGLMPLEIWNNGRDSHFGNPITEVKAPAPAIGTNEVDLSEVKTEIPIINKTEGGQNAIQERGAAEGVLREERPEVGLQEVRSGRTDQAAPVVKPAASAKEEVASYSTPQDEKTMYGKPEELLDRNVGDVLEDYETKVERAGGEEEFDRYAAQVHGLLKSEFAKAGLDPEDATDKVNDRFIAEIYDQSGAEKNDGKTVGQVLTSFVKGYKKTSPKSEPVSKPKSEPAPAPDKEAATKAFVAAGNEMLQADIDNLPEDEKAPVKAALQLAKDFREHEKLKDQANLADDLLDAVESLFAGKNEDGTPVNRKKLLKLIATQSTKLQNAASKALRTSAPAAETPAEALARKKAAFKGALDESKAAEKPKEEPAPKAKPAKSKDRPDLNQEQRDALIAQMPEADQKLIKKAYAVVGDLTMDEQYSDREIWRSSGNLKVNADSFVAGKYPNNQTIDRAEVMGHLRTEIAILEEFKDAVKRGDIIIEKRGRGESDNKAAQKAEGIEADRKAKLAAAGIKEFTPTPKNKPVSEPKIEPETAPETRINRGLESTLTKMPDGSGVIIDKVVKSGKQVGKKTFQKYADAKRIFDKNAPKSEPESKPASAPAPVAAAEAVDPLQAELTRKKAAFAKELRDSRKTTNFGADPIAAAKVIASGIDLLSTYTKIGIVKLRDIVKDLIKDFGKDFMDEHNTAGIRAAYASYRTGLPREERNKLDTDDDLDDFIEKELPVLVAEDVIPAAAPDSADTLQSMNGLVERVYFDDKKTALEAIDKFAQANSEDYVSAADNEATYDKIRKSEAYNKLAKAVVEQKALYDVSHDTETVRLVKSRATATGTSLLTSKLHDAFVRHIEAGIDRGAFEYKSIFPLGYAGTEAAKLAPALHERLTKKAAAPTEKPADKPAEKPAEKPATSAGDAISIAGFYDTTGSTPGDIHENGNLAPARKFKTDMTNFARALADSMGWEFETETKGKNKGRKIYPKTNIAPAGGDGTIQIFKPGASFGIRIDMRVERADNGDDLQAAQSIRIATIGRDGKTIKQLPAIPLALMTVGKVSDAVTDATVPSLKTPEQWADLGVNEVPEGEMSPLLLRSAARKAVDAVVANEMHHRVVLASEEKAGRIYIKHALQSFLTKEIHAADIKGSISGGGIGGYITKAAPTISMADEAYDKTYAEAKRLRDLDKEEAPKAPAQTVSLGKERKVYNLVGQNTEGKNIYENAEGIRALDNGNSIFSNEKISIIPTKEGITYSRDLNRDAEFMTADEITAKAATPVVVKVAFEQIGKAFKKRFGTNYQVISKDEAQRMMEDKSRELFFQILDDVDVFTEMEPLKAKSFILKVFQTVKDAEEAKKAYRKLTIKYHPDKISGGQSAKEEAFDSSGKLNLTVFQYLNDVYDKYKDGRMGSLTGSAPRYKSSTTRPTNKYDDPYGAAAAWMKRQKQKADDAQKAYEEAKKKQQQEAPPKEAPNAAKEADRKRRDDAKARFKKTRDDQTDAAIAVRAAALKAVEAEYIAKFEALNGSEKNREQLRAAYAEAEKARERVNRTFNDEKTRIDRDYKRDSQKVEDEFYYKYFFQRTGTGTIPAGFYDAATNTAYMVEGVADETTPIHEMFSHPFIAAIEKVNKPLFAQLLDTIAKNEDIMSFVLENYPGASEKIFAHEMIARAIDLEAKGQLKDKTLIDHIRDFWEAVSDLFKDLFGGKKYSAANMDAGTKVSDIVKFLLHSGERMNLAIAEEVKPPDETPPAEQKVLISEFWGTDMPDRAFKGQLSIVSRKLSEKLGWQQEIETKGKNKGRAIHATTELNSLGGEGVITLFKPGSAYGITIQVPVKRGVGEGGVEGLERSGEVTYRIATREDKYLGLPIHVGMSNFTVPEMAALMQATLDEQELKGGTDVTDTERRDTTLPDAAGPDETELDGAPPAGPAEETIPGGQPETIPGIGSGEGGAGQAGTDEQGTTGGRGGGGGKRGGSGTRGSGTKSGKSDETGGTRRNTRKSERVRPENIDDRNHVIEDTDVIVPEGKVAKVAANMDAVILLRKLEAEGRNATPEEKKQLAQFVGWGGLAEYLNKNLIDDTMAESIVEKIMKGGKVEQGYGYNRVSIELTPLDITGKTFDEVAKAIQKKYAEIITAPENQSLRRYVNSDNQSALGLDDARTLAIKGMLTQGEYETASRSTINAHYTERGIIKKMWDVARRLGFDGGNVFESSAGVGHFLGLMPQDIANASKLIGVELESISGRILQKLYPEGNMINKGFQYTTTPLNSQDIVIGNVPFGSTGLATDPNHPEISKFSLHDYFIAKNLKLLKPGGIAILITSSGTMDRPSSMAARRWFGSLEGGNSDFIGSVRLPNNAFDKNAGTQVTTDIMIFQKRKDKIARNENPIINTRNIKSEIREDEVREININEYYIAHPQNMIGEMMFAEDAGRGGLYDKWEQTLHAPKGTDVQARVTEIFETMPADIMNTDRGQTDTADKMIATREQEGRMFEKDGNLYVSEGDTATIAMINGKELSPARIRAGKDYIKLRELVHDQIALEQDDEATDAEIDIARRELNMVYDKFVDAHKYIDSNGFLYDLDSDYSLVSTLEDVETTIHVRESDGKQTKTFTTTKGDMLTKRVNFPRQEPKTAENMADAIQISVAYRNRINDDYVGKLLGIPAEDARQQLLDAKLVYEDPANGILETPEAYLSGNVRRKLQVAVVAAESEPRFLRNARALAEVVPQDIPASQASFKMGANWLPPIIYEDFLMESMGIEAKIDYIQSGGKWTVDVRGGHSDSRNTTSFAVADKSGVQIATDVMNFKSTVIKMDGRNEDGKTIRVTDPAKTAEADDMQKTIMDAFVNYVRGHEEHSKTLEKNFNDRFNSLVERKQNIPYFDYYPGASHDVKLRIHQLRAVLRALAGNTLFAHGVGTGKTYTIITTVMEMRRLGTARKPMIVVKNATLGAFARSFTKLYPAARILVPSAKDMTTAGRKRFFGRIATGNYDAIIVPHSQIDMMPDDPVRVQGYLQERIEELKAAIEGLDGSESSFYKKELQNQLKDLLEEEAGLFEENYVLDADGNPVLDADGTPKQMTKKDIEARNKERAAAIKAAKKALKEAGGRSSTKDDARADLTATARVEAQANRRTDKLMYFDNFGVDALIVDESHAYKRLGFQTSITNIRGIDTSASKKSLGVLMKIRSVMDKTGGKNIIFSTGTPITNTMAEAWTNLRYLAPELLQDMGIVYFDQFVNTFASIIPSLEQNAGNKAVIVQRLAKFFNLPELLGAFRSVADVVTTDDIPEFKEDPKMAPPKMKNADEANPAGRPTMVFIEISKPLAIIMRNLTRRYNQWQKMGGRDKRDHRAWPMMLTEIGKIAAIDIRLIDPAAPDEPDSKVNQMLGNAMENYHKYAQYKATQMIFSDNIQSSDSDNYVMLAGVSQEGAQGPAFNLYEDIKKKLIAKGVPAHEIAIVTDKKYKTTEATEKLAQDMNAGIIRFMIGSSEKMGVGVNAQERMIALHHLDAPKRPDLFEQRNGRILRQGNIFAGLDIPIDIRSYGIKGTRDATAYDRLRFKNNFVRQIMKGNYGGERESDDPAAEDVENADDFFAEMGAALTGSRAQVELVMANAALRTERNRKTSFAQRMKDTNTRLRNKTENLDELAARIEIDRTREEKKKEFFLDNQLKTVEVDGVVHTEKWYEVIDKKIAEIKKELTPSEEKVALMSLQEKKDFKSIDKFSFKLNGMEATMSIWKLRAENGGVEWQAQLQVPDLDIRKALGAQSAASMFSAFRNELERLEGIADHAQKEYNNSLRDIETLKKDLKATFDSTKHDQLQIRVDELTATILEESRKEELLEDAEDRGEDMGDTDDMYDGFQGDQDEMDEEDIAAAAPDLIKGLGWDNPDIDAEIKRTKEASDDDNLMFSGPGAIIMALPKLTKLAYLYMRKGLKTVGQFAQALGERLSRPIVQAWNQAKAFFRKRSGPGTVYPAMAPPPPPGGTPPPPPPGGTPPKGKKKLSALAQVAQDRNDAGQRAVPMLQALYKRLFGDEDITDAHTNVKKFNVLNVLNLLQDATVKKATGFVSKGFQKAAERAMNAQNKDFGKLMRPLGKAMNSLFAGLGKSAEDMMASEKFVGEGRVRSIADAIEISELLREMIKNDPRALSRINQVVDPEFYKERTYDEWADILLQEKGQEAFDLIDPKDILETYAAYRKHFGFDEPGYRPLTASDLNVDEKPVYEIIRAMYDVMHEINFSIAKLTPETYDKNKGNYSARLYDFYEIPPETEKAFANGGPLKMEEGLYMARGEDTHWKLMHGISDPIYAVSKRLAQTMSNKAIIDYTEYLLKNKPDATSADEKDGYRKLGNGYGALSRRWVRDDIAEDFVGHYYSNAMMQSFFEAFKIYDKKMPGRQFYKKAFTVYNPGVHMGNIMGNATFAWLSGVSLPRMAANVPWALRQQNEYSAIYRYLLSQGVLQTDATKADLQQDRIVPPKPGGPTTMGPTWEGVKELGTSINDVVQGFYSGTDDIAKIAAFKGLVDLGYSEKEAVGQVKQSFQNYRRVGKAYSFWSKVPLIGQPFGMFAGDLARILRTGVTTRPLQTMAMVAMLRGIAAVLSKWSGESDERRRVREAKAGAPMIPFFNALGGNIPLEWKIGGDTYNIARLLSPVFLYANASGDDSYDFWQKFSPQPIDIPSGYIGNPTGPVGVFVAQNVNDPVFGPLLQLAVDADFRGMPILDTDVTRYKGATLTAQERAVNGLRYLGRGYIPHGAAILDFVSSVKGEEDYYGRKKTPGQHLMSFFLGIKAAEFPPTKYGKILTQKMEGYGYEFKAQGRTITDIVNQYKDGEITLEKAQERVAPHIEKQGALRDRAEAEFLRLIGRVGNLDLSKDNPITRTNDPSRPARPKPGALPKLRPLKQLKKLPAIR